MNSIKDKIVLITGAGKGSGQLLAKAFAEHGAIVAANDISPINVDEVVDEINQKGGRAKAYIEDVAKKVGVQNLVNQVEDDFGRIDILVNHASVRPHAGVLEMDEWDWHRVLDVNMTGTFLMMQSVGRMMRGQGSGVIINLVTTNQASVENEAAFVASMNGLIGLTTQAAHELSQHGIQVHTVETGDGVVAQVLALFEEKK